MDDSSSAMPEQTYDVLVLGGGPAGSTVARLLAAWGHRVLMLHKEDRKPGLAESLPPSTRKLFRFLGILDQIDGAGFLRTSGNTTWWGDAGSRSERFPSGAEDQGYQVLRRDLDRLLRRLARDSGAVIAPVARIDEVDCQAGSQVTLACTAPDRSRRTICCRFVLDCSGRAGVLAHQGLRQPEPDHQTLALIGVWKRRDPWSLEDPTHTLVETYEDGWAWSIPVSPLLRYVAVMVDSRSTRLARGHGLETTYRTELKKARRIQHLLRGAATERPPWACDASLYSASCYAGSNFLLVGDAASFIDPLSSYGVKKALASAWTAAVVTNTCLTKPEMAHAATDFYSRREAEIYASYLRQSARYFRQAATVYPQAYWTRRAAAAAEAGGGAEVDEWRVDFHAADCLRRIQQSPALRLQIAPGVVLETQPGIRNREVVLEEAVRGPSQTVALRFLQGIDLPVLAAMAGQYRQLPDLFEAYNRLCPPVELGDFLAVLSVLVSRGILRHGP